MSRQQRRQDAQDLVRRLKQLPPERRGVIMTVLLSNSLVSVALQIVLLALVARSARRAFQARRGGLRSMTRAAVTPPVVLLLGLCGVHIACTKLVQPRWVEEVIRRSETSTQPRGD